jgi:hypothetical protein
MPPVVLENVRTRKTRDAPRLGKQKEALRLYDEKCG